MYYTPDTRQVALILVLHDHDYTLITLDQLWYVTVKYFLL